MAITTLNGLIAALPGQIILVTKTDLATTASGASSTFLRTGIPPAGVAPSSGVAGDIPTNATVGAISYVNPPGGATSYVGKLIINGGNGLSGWWVLYDRLWQNSGISSTLTSAQTINSIALTRPDANGVNAEVWWQVYGAMGAATPTVTLAYTNSDGTASRSASSGVLATGMIADRTGPFQLASGDTGVKSVQSWTADTSFVSGTIGLVIRRPIVAFPELNVITTSPYPYIADAFALAMSKINDSSCLELVFYALNTQTANPHTFSMNIVQG